MRRWVWLGMAVALLVAIGFGWRAIRERELRGLVDEPPAVAIQAEQWRLFHDHFMDSAFFARLRASDAVAEVLASPGGRDFLDLRNGLEVVLDEDPAQLFLRTFGRRLEGGVWLRKTGGFALGIVSLPEEGTDLADVAARIDVMAKSSPQEPSQQVEGMTVFPLGEGVMVFGDEVAVLASHETLGLTLARSWGDRVREREAVPPGVHVHVGPEVYGGDFSDTRLDDALQTLGSLVLFGGVTRVLNEAQNLRIDLVPVDRGVRAQARFDVGLEALGAEGGGYAPLLDAETPLAADEILRLEISRDLARFWEDRELHLAPSALAEIERDESEAGLEGMTRQAFEGLDHTLMLRVLNEGPARGRPLVPAAGLVARLRDESLGAGLERVFELAIENATRNVGEAGSISLEPPFNQNGTRLRRIHIESPELSEAGEDWREWVDPVWVRDGTQVVVASTPGLVPSLLAPLPAAVAQGEERASDRIRVRAEPLRQALLANFEVLIENQMGEREIDRAQSERELRGVVTILEGLDDARLEWAHGEQETVFSLTLRGR